MKTQKSMRKKVKLSSHLPMIIFAFIFVIFKNNPYIIIFNIGVMRYSFLTNWDHTYIIIFNVGIMVF